jgi:hypothetical protein
MALIVYKQASNATELEQLKASGYRLEHQWSIHLGFATNLKIISHC